MTPKEKALELFNKFDNFDFHDLSDHKHSAKQGALIVVNEVISACKFNYVERYNTDWWEKVKFTESHSTAFYKAELKTTLPNEITMSETIEIDFALLPQYNREKAISDLVTVFSQSLLKNYTKEKISY